MMGYIRPSVVGGLWLGAVIGMSDIAILRAVSVRADIDNTLTVAEVGLVVDNASACTAVAAAVCGGELGSHYE